jgi:hypothetical protein
LSQKFLTSPLGIVIALRTGVPDKKSEKSSFFLNFLAEGEERRAFFPPMRALLK